MFVVSVPDGLNSGYDSSRTYGIKNSSPLPLMEQDAFHYQPGAE